MTEGIEFQKSEPKKTPQDILREKIANLQFQSSRESIDISELAGGTEKLPESISSISLLIGRRYLYLFRNDIPDPEHPHAELQIGRFELDEDGNVTGFIPDAHESLVRQTMYSLKHVPFFNELRERFNIEDLNEEDLRAAMQIANESRQKAQELQREIDALNSLAEENRLKEPRKKIDIEDDKLVCSVNEGEVGILGEGSKKRFLESLGAGPCIIVTAYDPDNKIAAMAHIDGLTDEEATLAQLFRVFKDVDTVEIRVFGGDPSSINQLVSIKKILEEKGVVVREWDILNTVKFIILDRETGEIFDVEKVREREDASEQDPLVMRLRSLQGKQPAKIKWG